LQTLVNIRTGVKGAFRRQGTPHLVRVNVLPVSCIHRSANQPRDPVRQVGIGDVDFQELRVASKIPAESRILLEKHMAPAIVPSRVYGQGYEPRDVAVWDNFSIWRSATGGLAVGDRRVIHMASFNGSVEPRLS
jgi:hypothetical protein